MIGEMLMYQMSTNNLATLHSRERHLFKVLLVCKLQLACQCHVNLGEDLESAYGSGFNQMHQKDKLIACVIFVVVSSIIIFPFTHSVDPR